MCKQTPGEDKVAFSSKKPLLILPSPTVQEKEDIQNYCL